MKILKGLLCVAGAGAIVAALAMQLPQLERRH
jgi:hypothetical protein